MSNTERGRERDDLRLGYPKPDRWLRIMRKFSGRLHNFSWINYIIKTCHGFSHLLTTPLLAAKPTKVSIQCACTQGSGGAWESHHDNKFVPSLPIQE